MTLNNMNVIKKIGFVTSAVTVILWIMLLWIDPDFGTIYGNDIRFLTYDGMEHRCFNYGRYENLYFEKLDNGR